MLICVFLYKKKKNKVYLNKQNRITDLLYIRTSGFHNLFGVIRKSLTPPYSESFHFKL